MIDLEQGVTRLRALGVPVKMSDTVAGSLGAIADFIEDLQAQLKAREEDRPKEMTT